MITISQQQLGGFAERAEQTFEQRMFGHLNRFFAEQCRTLGDRGVGESIRQGVLRARVYGITSQREVCKFIDLMYVLGVDFDTRLKIAERALTDSSVPTTERVTRLTQICLAGLAPLAIPSL